MDVNEVEPETQDYFYNCSECSSLIEIIYLDDINIEFKCFNKNNPHKIKISIKEYINAMKIKYREINNEKCMINKHNKMNECYCLECNIQLCDICLKSREHLLHNKINIKEILPRENELNIINNIIKDIKDIKNQDLKNLYEIIYNSYNTNNYNYYYCLNVNYILNNYIEKNNIIKEKLSKEEYENIIKIKNIKKENRIDEKSENANINVINRRKNLKDENNTPTKLNNYYGKIKLKEELEKEKKEEIIEKPIRTSPKNSVEKYSRFRRLSSDYLKEEKYEANTERKQREKEENKHKFIGFSYECHGKTNGKEIKNKSKNSPNIFNRRRLFNNNIQDKVKKPEIRDDQRKMQKPFGRTYYDGFRRYKPKLDDDIPKELDINSKDEKREIFKNYFINKTLEENENNKKKYLKINSKKDIKEISNKKKTVETFNFKYIEIKYNSNKKDNINNKNKIKCLLDIKLKEIINNNIILFNTNIEDGIDVYLKNKKINMIRYDKSWYIDYGFEKEGIYEFQIIFSKIFANMYGFFEKCNNIISIDLSNFNSSNVTDMAFMFSECNKLKEIKGLNKFNTNKVNNMVAVFQECKELEYLDLSNFNTNNVTEMQYMFNKCMKLKVIKGLNVLNTNKVNNMRSMFQLCSELKYLDLSNFNTSNVTNMSFMFSKCYALKVIKGLNKFNTNKVKSMKTMFQSCSELEYLDLSNFNTENVIDMSYMFSSCNKLKEIKGLNKFNTNKINNMKAMFQLCKELEYLDLSNFDTENVIDMSNMFASCNKLKELRGINKFKTNKVKNMKAMFNECTELQSLDLSNFYTENVTDMEGMFNKCDKLKYLNLLNFSIKCETKNMMNFNRKDKFKFITNNKDLLALFNSIYL